MRARCGHCSARTSNQMLRRMLPTAERTVTPVRQQKKSKTLLTKEARLENGPSNARAPTRNSDGRVDCEHVSGLLTRHHVRWPRWGPRSSPKQFCGFESRHANRVLWIIGSTDRHLIELLHPGNNAVPVRRAPSPVTRVIVTRRMGHPVAQSRPKPRGGSIAWSSERSSSIIARKASASALSC